MDSLKIFNQKTREEDNNRQVKLQNVLLYPQSSICFYENISNSYEKYSDDKTNY